MRSLTIVAIAFFMLNAVSGASYGQHKTDASIPPATVNARDSVPVLENAVSTKHMIGLGGKTIAYTATAGNLLIRDSSESSNASIFYVAYRADGVPAVSRPVTFFFNGGPPAASMWLHMASFGPVRVVTRTPSSPTGPPFQYVANELSLLDHSDLVFIDAPLCGFSRSVGHGKAADFEGTDEDVAAFEKFIFRWLTVNERWDSPKYLFGESYGGTRAAALVATLQNDGVTFNGVVLESPVLNYNVRAPGYDNQSIGYLPTYAAIAFFYHRAETKDDLVGWVAKAREFALGPYASALLRGNALPPEDFDTIAKQVSAFTGLSVQYVKQAKLRIDPARYRKELLRADGKTLGRYDARVQGVDRDSTGDVPLYDASESDILGPVLASFRKYLSSELNFKTNETYYPSAPEPSPPWNWHHRTPDGVQEEQPDVALDLSDAMRKNPHLKVFVASGYFDLGTPFAITEYDLHHMLLDNDRMKNIVYGYYPAGHMVYLNIDALMQMKSDLSRFYESP